MDLWFRARDDQVGPSWRVDETYVRVKGTWKYLYWAVDKASVTVDFLLTAKRDRSKRRDADGMGFDLTIGAYADPAIRLLG